MKRHIPSLTVFCCSFLKCFWRTHSHVLLWGLWVPLFWIFGDLISRGLTVFFMYFQGVSRAVGLAVDTRAGLLFWSDIDPDYRGIYSATLDGENAQRIVQGE